MSCPDHITHPEHWAGDAGDVAASLAPFPSFEEAMRAVINYYGTIPDTGGPIRRGLTIRPITRTDLDQAHQVTDAWLAGYSAAVQHHRDTWE